MRSAPTRISDPKKALKLSILAKYSAERQARLQQIRADVENGTYQVDAAALSKAIIDRHIGRK